MTLRGKGVIKLCSERIHVNITQTVKSDGLHDIMRRREGEERSHVNINSLHSQTSAESAGEPNQFDLLCDNVNTSMVILNNSLQEVGRVISVSSNLIMSTHM